MAWRLWPPVAAAAASTCWSDSTAELGEGNFEVAMQTHCVPSWNPDLHRHQRCEWGSDRERETTSGWSPTCSCGHCKLFTYPSAPNIAQFPLLICTRNTKTRISVQKRFCSSFLWGCSAAGGEKKQTKFRPIQLRHVTLMASWRGMEWSGGGSRGPAVPICAVWGVVKRSLVALVILGDCGAERKEKK